MMFGTNADKMPLNMPDYLDRMFKRGKYQPPEKPNVCKNYIEDFYRTGTPKASEPAPDEDQEPATPSTFIRCNFLAAEMPV